MDTEQACQRAFDFLYVKMDSYGYCSMYVDFPVALENLSTYFSIQSVGDTVEAQSQAYPGLPTGKHIYLVSWAPHEKI